MRNAKHNSALRILPENIRRALKGILRKRFGLLVCRSGSSWTLQEPEQLSRFIQAFDVDCIFDVGANEGQYGSRLREIGFTGRIISFEPNPDAAAILKRIASRDALWNVFEIALDSEERDVEFNVMEESQLSSILTPDLSPIESYLGSSKISRKLKIRTKTLDKLYPELVSKYKFSVPFLKMDTQGHDYAVVTGAINCINSFAGIQSELSLTPLYIGAKDYHETIEFYKDMGFRLSALVANNAGHFPDLNEVDCIMYNSNMPKT